MSFARHQSKRLGPCRAKAGKRRIEVGSCYRVAEQEERDQGRQCIPWSGLGNDAPSRSEHSTLARVISGLAQARSNGIHSKAHGLEI